MCATGDPKKMEHLLVLDGAKERLQLFKADLLEEGAFDSVVHGCEGVFHTASPYFHNVIDPQVRSVSLRVKQWECHGICQYVLSKNDQFCIMLGGWPKVGETLLPSNNTKQSICYIFQILMLFFCVSLFFQKSIQMRLPSLHFPFFKTLIDVQWVVLLSHWYYLYICSKVFIQIFVSRWLNWFKIKK